MTLQGHVIDSLEQASFIALQGHTCLNTDMCLVQATWWGHCALCKSPPACHWSTKGDKQALQVNNGMSLEH